VILLLLFSFNAFALNVPAWWLYDNAPIEKSNDDFSMGMSHLISDMLDILPEVSKDKSNSSFELTEISTMLGVTASGTIGVLGLSGSALAEIHWARSQSRKNKKSADLIVNDFSQIDQKIESIAYYLEKSGKVEPGTQVRKNLRQAANSFRKNYENLRTLHRSWKLSAVQANFGVSASGQVGTSIFRVGVDTELTFEWSFSEPTVTKSFDQPRPIEQIVWAIQDDISKALEGSKYLRPFEWEIGLGVGLDGELGLASAGVSIGTTLVFAPNENTFKDKENFVLSPTLPLIVQSDNKNIDRVIKLGRRKFRKGLKKALRIGDSLARKAKKASKNRKWQYSGMTTEFALDLEGGIGVVTLSGGAAVKIEFERRDL